MVRILITLLIGCMPTNREPQSTPHVLQIWMRSFLLQSDQAQPEVIATLGLENTLPLFGTFSLYHTHLVYSLRPTHQLVLIFSRDIKRRANVLHSITISARAQE
jgi:hypothetical protein